MSTSVRSKSAAAQTILRAKIFAHQVLSSINNFIAPVLRSLPFLRTILRLPSGRIHSLQVWVTETQREVVAGSRAPSYRVVQPPIAARKPEPGHSVAISSDAEQAFAGIVKVHPEVFLASIPRGRLLGPGCVALTPDNRIIEESAWTSDGWLERDRAVVSLSLPRPEVLSGEYFTIASFSSSGYAHWVLDALPRLSLLSYLPDAGMRLVVSNALKSWQQESLAVVSIDSKDVVSLGTRYVELEQLHLPSYIGRPGAIHPFACNWLRKNFIAGGDSKSARRRLYITRRLARRCVINESELQPTLDRYGFEVVESEKLSFLEQVSLFSEAEAVIGAHGAGLTNIVFAPAACQVFELFAETCVRAMYYQLAGVIGQSYWYLVGRALPKPEHGDSGFDDMRICPEQFEQTLRQMLQTRASPQG